MGEDDEEHGNAAEERTQILMLQSEQFRKQEQLDRLRGRIRALEEELTQREFELSDVQRRCDQERQVGTKRAPGEDRTRAANAEDDFLRSEVQRMLQERVPAMAPVEEEGEEEGTNYQAATGPKQEDPGKTGVHDTVLVSYVQMSEGRQEDYKVSYRIDSHTTVEQLHRDACAYWGCSRKDYSLWKLDQNNKPTRLFKTPKPGDVVQPKLLQDADVLNPAEQAHLHLCREPDEIRKARQRERERERKEGERKSQPETQGAEVRQSHDVLKTLKHGLGYATHEKQPEEFVDAFRPWPGIYHLLANRDRAARKQKWHHVYCSDILVYGFLILLSSICIAYRHNVNHYLLREGVMQTLVRGVKGETFETEADRRLLTPLEGLPPGMGTFTPLTPGMMWMHDTNGVKINATSTEQQVAQSTLPLAPDLINLKLTAIWIPPPTGCYELGITFAQSNPFDNPGTTFKTTKWTCQNVTATGFNNTYAFVNHTPCLFFAQQGGPMRYEAYNTGDLVLRLGEHAIRDGDQGTYTQSCVAYIPGTAADGTTYRWNQYFKTGSVSYLFLHGMGGGQLTNIVVTGTHPKKIGDFRDIKTWTQLHDYVVGPFAYQLLEATSSLGSYYRLASALRFRQQMAAPKACVRTKVPYNLQRTCAHVLTDSAASEERTQLPPLPGSALLPRESLTWKDNPVGAAGFYGDVQRYYEASGYMYDIPRENMTFRNAGITRQRADVALSNSWITTRTRLWSMEFLLSNKNLGGHVVVQLNLEVPPSGAINPRVELIPVRLAKSYSESVASALDIVRLVVVIIFLLGIRIWRETKAKVSAGLSGMAYFLSMEGVLDVGTIALYLAMQYMRIQNVPELPTDDGRVFRSYSHLARNLQQLDLFEAVHLLLLIIRFSSFGRLFSVVYRFFRTYSAALMLFAYYLTMFLPVFLSCTFFANATYAPYLFDFSTFLQSCATMLFAVKESHRVEELLKKSTWTIPFLTYFFLSTLAFFIHGFLAITVHAYWEVQLVDGSEPNEDGWSTDDWLRWMLWKPVYSWLAGKTSDKKDADGADTDSDSDTSSDEEVGH